MANKKGQLVCSTNSKNTGFGSCVEEWKQIAGAFLFDNPRTFTDVELAVLQATLLAAANNNSKSARMYPLHNFVGITDSSESVVIETFNYGPKAIVRDGDYDWTFQFTDGGNCLQQAARSHNGKKWILFYDKDYKILGYNKLGSMATIPLQFFYAHPWKPATGANAAQYMIQMVFLPKYINEERAFIKADFDPAEIEGLQDVDIVVNSWDQDTGIANVTLQKACGAENMYDDYGTQIAATANFTAVDDAGNAVTVEAVAKVPASKTFDITLTLADLPEDGIVTLSGAAVSVLTAANVPGYEIGSAELEVVGSGS